MKRGFYLTRSLALLLIALAATGAMGAKTLVIQVSDELDMKNIEATKVSDQTCLPLRTVAESMGAKVTYDVDTRAIIVSGEPGTAKLKLGETSAEINGTRVNLSIAPFMYGERVFAPIGFYNNYFNMGLQWDPFMQAYRWIWILPPAPYPVPPVIYGPGSGTQSGNEYATAPGYPSARRLVAEVLGVQPAGANSTIAVAVGKSEATYRVAQNATILRGRVGGRASEVSLGEVRPGDRVTLVIDQSGMVASIRAQYQQVQGTIQSIGDGRIVLDSGRTLKTTDETRVILPGGATGRMEDLRIGDQVVASVGPISGETYVISVQPSSAAQESNILLSSYGPLTTGDILRVAFRGSPNGKALLTIPGLLSDAPMAETAPGVYEAQYVVKPGDVLPSLPIKVSFAPRDGTLYETLSARPVTIVTESAFLPRIISPRTGQAIGSPITVTGIAHPNARVQVTVEFLRDIGGVLPLQGLTGEQVVRADADGVWKTGLLPATAPWDDITTELPADYGVLTPFYRLDEYPTTFVITATEFGTGGGRQASYSVQALRGPVGAGL